MYNFTDACKLQADLHRFYQLRRSNAVHCTESADLVLSLSITSKPQN